MKSIIEKFKDKKILVIGDIMLDEYIYGDVTRINPEAPVPVLNAQKIEFRLGGAANVAANVVSLGGQCVLIGRVGADDIKNKIISLLNEKKIFFKLVEQDSFDSIKKTRIIARAQQVVRVDWEKVQPIDAKGINEVMNFINVLDFDLMILSDYGKGMFVQELVDNLKGLGKKIIVDPKPQNMSLFKDTFLITPNFKEAKEITRKEDLMDAGLEIVNNFGCHSVITRGGEGCSFFEKQGSVQHIPSIKIREVYDVVGAGDTFISAISLALATGANFSDACTIANHAAGISVSKRGTATVSPEELLNAFDS